MVNAFCEFMSNTINNPKKFLQSLGHTCSHISYCLTDSFSNIVYCLTDIFSNIVYCAPNIFSNIVYCAPNISETTISKGRRYSNNTTKDKR